MANCIFAIFFSSSSNSTMFIIALLSRMLEIRGSLANRGKWGKLGHKVTDRFTSNIWVNEITSDKRLHRLATGDSGAIAQLLHALTHDGLAGAILDSGTGGIGNLVNGRSEERRVGKECRSR